MRRAVLTGALVLGLAACGGSRDVAGSPSASPTPEAAGAPGDQQCPLQAAMADPPAGAVTDLAVKPTIAASSAPPPAEVTVADIVVGTGAEATTLSQVEAKYVGALYTTGAEFDSSWSRGADETIAFGVCATGTVPGFAVAPEGMRVGGRRQVTIPAEYAYGEQGRPPTIPPNSPLVFVIDLVEVTPPPG